MPSRIRIVVGSNREGPFVGTRAKRWMVKEWPGCPYLKPFKAKNLADWVRDQQGHTKGFATKGYYLRIWRERRGARNSKRWYWQTVGKKPRQVEAPPRREGRTIARWAEGLARRMQIPRARPTPPPRAIDWYGDAGMQQWVPVNNPIQAQVAANYQLAGLGLTQAQVDAILTPPLPYRQRNPNG
jgi:hypothetical protein